MYYPTPPCKTPTLPCPFPYPTLPLCSDHMHYLPYPTQPNPTHPNPPQSTPPHPTPPHPTLPYPALPYPTLLYSTLRRGEESKEKNSLTKTYTNKTEILTNDTLQIPLKLNSLKSVWQRRLGPRSHQVGGV